MIIEDMSYLIDVDNRDVTHYSQEGDMIKVKVLYIVADTPEDQAAYPFRHVSIRIPRYYPIYRVRTLLVKAEETLKDIYGLCIRVGFLVQPNGEGPWKLMKQLPVNEVVYL